MAKQTKKAWEPLYTSSNEEHNKALANIINARGINRLAQEEVASEGTGEAVMQQMAEGFSRPFALGASAGAEALGIRKYIDDYVGLPDPVTQTRMIDARNAQTFEQKYPDGTLGRGLRGAVGALQQVPSMMGVGQVAGLGGLITMFSGQAYNDAYVQALDNGLTEDEAQKQGAIAAAIEAGFTFGFSKAFGGRFSGTEGMATAKQLPRAARETIARRAASFLGNRLAPELVEELSIEAANALRESMSVDPTATDGDKLLDRAIDTAIQTTFMTLIMQGWETGTRIASTQKRLTEENAKIDELNKKYKATIEAINERAKENFANGMSEEDAIALAVKEKQALGVLAFEEYKAIKFGEKEVTDEDLQKELEESFAPNPDAAEDGEAEATEVAADDVADEVLDEQSEEITDEEEEADLTETEEDESVAEEEESPVGINNRGEQVYEDEQGFRYVLEQSSDGVVRKYEDRTKPNETGDIVPDVDNRDGRWTTLETTDDFDESADVVEETSDVVEETPDVVEETVSESDQMETLDEVSDTGDTQQDSETVAEEDSQTYLYQNGERVSISDARPRDESGLIYETSAKGAAEALYGGASNTNIKKLKKLINQKRYNGEIAELQVETPVDDVVAVGRDEQGYYVRRAGNLDASQESEEVSSTDSDADIAQATRDYLDELLRDKSAESATKETQESVQEEIESVEDSETLGATSDTSTEVNDLEDEDIDEDPIATRDRIYDTESELDEYAGFFESSSGDMMTASDDDGRSFTIDSYSPERNEYYAIDEEGQEYYVDADTVNLDPFKDQTGPVRDSVDQSVSTVVDRWDESSDGEKKDFAGRWLDQDLTEEERNSIQKNYRDVESYDTFEKEAMRYAPPRKLKKAHEAWREESGFNKNADKKTTNAKNAAKQLIAKNNSFADDEAKLKTIDGLLDAAKKNAEAQQYDFNATFYKNRAEVMGRRVASAIRDVVPDVQFLNLGVLNEAFLNPDSYKSFVKILEGEKVKLERSLGLSKPEKKPEPKKPASVDLSDASEETVTLARRGLSEPTKVTYMSKEQAAAALGVSEEILDRAFADADVDAEFAIPAARSGRGVVGKILDRYYGRTQTKEEPDNTMSAGTLADFSTDKSFGGEFANLRRGEVITNKKTGDTYTVPKVPITDTQSQRKSYGKLVQWMTGVANRAAAINKDKSPLAREIKDLDVSSLKKQLAVPTATVDDMANYIMENFRREGVTEAEENLSEEAKVLAEKIDPENEEAEQTKKFVDGVLGVYTYLPFKPRIIANKGEVINDPGYEGDGQVAEETVFDMFGEQDGVGEYVENLIESVTDTDEELSALFSENDLASEVLYDYVMAKAEAYMDEVRKSQQEGQDRQVVEETQEEKKEVTQETQRLLNSPYRKKVLKEYKDGLYPKQTRTTSGGKKVTKRVRVDETVEKFMSSKQKVAQWIEASSISSNSRIAKRLANKVLRMSSRGELAKFMAGAMKVPEVIEALALKKSATLAELIDIFSKTGLENDSVIYAKEIAESQGLIVHAELSQNEMTYFDAGAVVRSGLRRNGWTHAQADKAELLFREIITNETSETPLFAESMTDRNLYSIRNREVVALVNNLNELLSYEIENDFKPFLIQASELGRQAGASDGLIEEATSTYVDGLIEDAKAESNGKQVDVSQEFVNNIASSIFGMIEQNNKEASDLETAENSQAYQAVAKALADLAKKIDASDVPKAEDFDSIDDFNSAVYDLFEKQEGFAEIIDEIRKSISEISSIESSESAREHVKDGIEGTSRKKWPNGKPMVPKKTTGKKKTKTREAADTAKKEADEAAKKWKDRVRRSHGGGPILMVQTDLVREAVQLALLKIKANVLSFAAFVDDMLRSESDADRELFGPYLQAAWKELSKLTDEEKELLGISNADLKMEGTWREVIDGIESAEQSEEADLASLDENENYDYIAESQNGRSLPGTAMFISGAQGNRNDLIRASENFRAVGLSLFQFNKREGRFFQVTDSVMEAALAHVNRHKLPLFIDSGAVSMAKALGEKGLLSEEESANKYLDFDRVFELYESFLDKIDPSLRSLVHIVAPDYLVTAKDGSIRSDFERTLELQGSYREEIRNLADMGASIIVPIHKQFADDTNEDLSSAFSLVTEELDWGPNYVMGIPYNHARWSDDTLMNFVEGYSKNPSFSPLRMHMLGGGAGRLEKIYNKLREIFPSISVTGDAVTEIVNRGKYDVEGRRKPAGLNKNKPLLMALVEHLQQGLRIETYAEAYRLIDEHSPNYREPLSDSAVNRTIDEAVLYSTQILAASTQSLQNGPEVFAQRLLSLFRNQPNQRFYEDGTALLYANSPGLYAKEINILKAFYLQLTKTSEDYIDEGTGQTDNTGRGKGTGASDTSDTRSSSEDGRGEQSDEVSSDQEQDSVGVREDDAEGSRRGGKPTDSRRDDTQRGESDSKRPTGDRGGQNRGRAGATDSVRGNYHLTEDMYDMLLGAGPKDRFARNKKAIALADEILERNEPPSQEELDVLASYVGWGAFGQELFDGTWKKPKPAEGWEDEDAWLRDHLGEDAWKSMQISIANAHFTTPKVASEIWRALRKLGFNGGRVLEPAVGAGNFFAVMPRDMMSNSHLTGVELDITTAKIASILYPNATIRSKGYQKLKTADNFYDLVVSNVPFSQIKIGEGKYEESYNTHNYFFRRAFDHVKPGGLVAFITSSTTADGSMGAGNLRKLIQKEGSVVGMVRMPSNMFKKYAGTAVVTDLIIIRKNRSDGRNPDSKIKWWSSEGKNNVVEYVPEGKSKDEAIKVNKHWLDNPKDVLGTLDFGPGTTFGRPGMVVTNATEEEALSKLDDWIGRLPDNIFRTDAAEWLGAETESDTEMRQNTILVNSKKKAVWRKPLGTKAKPVLNPDGTRAYEEVELDGEEIGIYSGESIVPLQQVVGWARSNSGKDKLQERLNELRDLARVREAYSNLLQEQKQLNSKKIAKARAKLNEVYDDFVAKYGQIENSESINVFKKAQDPMAYALEVLSYRSSETGEYVKRGIFSASSVVETIKELKNASLGDAFAAERNRSPVLDYKRIAKSANMTLDKALKELLEAGFIYKDETGGYEPADTFLAGNVRKKLRELKAAKDEGVEDLDKSIAAVEKIIPPFISRSSISLSLAPHFIPSSVYRQFLADRLSIDPDRLVVRLRAGKWVVQIPPDINASEAALSIGVPHINDNGNPIVPFSTFVTKAMNNGSIQIYDEAIKIDGQTVRPRQINIQRTADANNKLAVFKQSFAEWAWIDQARAEYMEDLYNEQYNSFVTPNFSNVPLTFIGIVKERNGKKFSLRKHQREAVWRGLLMGKGIFAHEVGTGKTLTMAALAMESRRFGVYKKPMLFAHNINSRQVADEIREAYPMARVLYLDNISKEAREKTMGMIAAEDWDLIVVPHSLTDRFSLSEDTIRDLVKDQLDMLEEAIADAFETEDNAGAMPEDLDNVSDEELKRIRSRTAKDLVKERLKIVEQVDRAASLNKSNTIFFEDMGVDMIMVDEAHVYKKIPISSIQDLKGLNKKGSKAGIMLDLLTTYVRRTNDGNGIYTFTGTPITNTLNEIFNQMRYVMFEEMRDAKMHYWDSWYSLFAEGVLEPELTTGGTWETVERLRTFKNLPELRQILGQYLDIVKAKDMEEFVDRKQKDGRVPDDESPEGVPFNEINNVSIKPNDLQVLMQKALRARYEKSKTAKGREYKELRGILGDPYSQLTIQNEGIAMSLDPRLSDYFYNPDYEMNDIDPKDPSLKINQMISKAMPLYKEDDKTTQMIFMQRGFKGTATRSLGKDEDGKKIEVIVNKFNLAREIKSRLIEEGVKESEIVIFSDIKKPEQKAIAAKKMQRGEIRFAIGSTESMGTGVNAQNYMRAIHHLDCPWMPGDLEQRIGRAVRQGNRWNTVLQYRYIMENESDARRWQIALIKDAMIQMFLDFNFSQRSFDMSEIDLDEKGGADLDSSLAVAAGDPRIILRNKLAVEMQRLADRESAYRKQIDDQLRLATNKQEEIGSKEMQASSYRRIAGIYEQNRDASELSMEMEYGPNKGKSITGSFVKQTDDGRELKRDRITEELMQVEDAWESKIRLELKKQAGKKGKYPPGVPIYNKLGTIRGLAIYASVTPQISNSRGSMTIQSHGMYIGEDLPSQDLRMRNMIKFGGTKGSFLAKMSLIGKETDRIDREIVLAEESLDRAVSASKQPYPQKERMDKLAEQLERISKEIQQHPNPSPSWFKNAAPAGSLVFYKGKSYVVNSHRGISSLLVTDPVTDELRDLPAKDVTESDGGLPVYKELQDDFEGEIESYEKETKKFVLTDKPSGMTVSVDIGSYSNRFTDEELARIGFDATRPSTYIKSGRVSSNSKIGDEIINIEFDDVTVDPETLPDGTLLPKVPVQILPQMDTSYALSEILTEENEVLDAMIATYNQGITSGWIVEGEKSPQGTRLSTETVDSSTTPPVLNDATLSFDELLEAFLYNMDRKTAQEYDELGVLESTEWLDEKLGGQLHVYDAPVVEEEAKGINDTVRIERDRDDVLAIYDKVNERVAEVLGRTTSNLQAPKKSMARGANKPMKGVPTTGEGGSRSMPFDVPRNRKIGDPASANPLSAPQIIERVGSMWDLPIRRGLVSNALGFYRHIVALTRDPQTGDEIKSPRVVRLHRLHSNNLAVLAHEVAHHVDNITDTFTALPDNIRSLLPDFDYLPNRSDRKTAVTEGFAEFMRAYLTLTRKSKKKIAGYDVIEKWFNNQWAKENPKEYALVQKTKKLLKRYSDQSTYERLQSSVSSVFNDSPAKKAVRLLSDLSNPTGRKLLFDKNLRDKVTAAYTASKDMYYPLRVLQNHIRKHEREENRQRKKQGKKKLSSMFEGSISAYEFATATHNTAATQAEEAFMKGVFYVSQSGSTSSRPVITGTEKLQEVLSNMTQKEVREAETWLVADHILSMKATRGGKAWPMTLEEAAAYSKNVFRNAEKSDKFNKLKSALVRFNNALLFMLEDAGVITAEDRDNMLRAYSVNPKDLDGDLYLPMHRVTDKNKKSYASSSHVDFGTAVKRRSKDGSVLPVVSPIVATIQRAITFYRTANSVQLQQLLLDELENLEGSAKFGERITPMMRADGVQLLSVLQQLVDMGIMEDAQRDAIVAAEALKQQTSGTGRFIQYGSTQDIDTVLTYAGMSTTGYSDADIRLALESIPDGRAMLLVWSQDFVGPTRKNDNIKVLLRQGEKVLVQFDPMMVKALSGASDLMRNPFVRLSRATNKWFKYGSVAINTMFGMRQIPMDYVANFMQAREQGVDRFYAPLFHSAAFALRALTFRNRDVTDNVARSLFRQYGGEIMHELTPDAKGIDALIRGTVKKSLGLKAATAAAKAPLKLMEQLIAFSDVGPRFAEFTASLRNDGYIVSRIGGKITDQQGRPVIPTRDSILRAINAARDVTYNFNRIGHAVHVGEQFLPFTNAKLEGIDKAGRTYGNLAAIGKAVVTGRYDEIDTAAKRQAMYTATGSIFLVGLGFLYALSKIDDEEYEEEEFYQRGTGVSFGGKDGVQGFFVPVSREHSFLTSLGEYLASVYAENEGIGNLDPVSEKEKDMRFTLNNLSDRFEPTTLGWRYVDATLNRTVGDPKSGFGVLDSGYLGTLFQLATGFDSFRDSPVEPLWMEQQKIPDSERINLYTSETAKKIGSYTGALGLSPIEVDFLMNNFSGGSITRNIRTGERLYGGEVNDLRNLPFVGGIYTNRHQKLSVGDMYDMSEFLHSASQEKKYDIDGGKYTEDHEAYRQVIDDAKSLVSLLNKYGAEAGTEDKLAIGRLQVGLAREALGRDEHISNVSPWKLQKKDLIEALTKENEKGDSFWTTMVEQAERIIKTTDPPEVTKDFYEDSGRTRSEEKAYRQKRAKFAAEWLQKHEDSPAVIEARKNINSGRSKSTTRRKKGFVPKMF